MLVALVLAWWAVGKNVCTAQLLVAHNTLSYLCLVGTFKAVMGALKGAGSLCFDHCASHKSATSNTTGKGLVSSSYTILHIFIYYIKATCLTAEIAHMPPSYITAPVYHEKPDENALAFDE